MLFESVDGYYFNTANSILRSSRDITNGYIRQHFNASVDFENNSYDFISLIVDYTGYKYQFIFNVLKDSKILNTTNLKLKFIHILESKLNVILLQKIYETPPYNMVKGAGDFHSKCNGKGATVTIFHAKSKGAIFGGYTSISWSTPWLGLAKSYKSDPNAFLFSLQIEKNQTGYDPKLFDIKHDKIDYAVAHYSDYGPSFGSTDLIIEHSLQYSNEEEYMFSMKEIHNDIHIKPDAYNFESYKDLCAEQLWSSPPYEVWKVNTK